MARDYPISEMMSTRSELSVTKCGAGCLFDPVRLGVMMIAHSPSLLLWASPTSFAPRDSRSDPPGLRSHEPSGSQIYRGRTPAFMRRRPRWVARCSVHVPLSKPPQPTADAKGAGVPERKIGFEALEASAKLRKKQHRLFERSEFRGCPKRAANASRRGATEAKGWQLL